MAGRTPLAPILDDDIQARLRPCMTVGVLHVMRTYGVHGGENQLAQLFTSFSNPLFRHFFCFVYRDDACARYFSSIQNLSLVTLLPLRSRAFPSLPIELAILLLFLPALQIRLVFTLKRNNCRICVAHGLQGAMISWLAAILLKDFKFVYVHRGTKSAMGKMRLFKWLYKPFDVVAGVSQASAASLSGLIDLDKLRVLENGIDWQEMDRKRQGCNPRNDKLLVITCVSRLVPAKGQRLLLQAFAKFHHAYPDSELWVVGSGPESIELKRVAEKFAIAPKVRFLGHISDVSCILAQSDIFTHASESEGLSNAVLEAMVVGLPSVVVDAPGVSECHLDGTTGYVVRRSVEAIVEKWMVLAGDHELRANMAQEARRRACTHYSIQENANRYDALYQRLAG